LVGEVERLELWATLWRLATAAVGRRRSGGRQEGGGWVASRRRRSMRRRATGGVAEGRREGGLGRDDVSK
jgi:hypothetical protein